MESTLSVTGLSDYAHAFNCGVEAWSGFWGDPMLSGTVMMAAYALAAILVVQASSQLKGFERAIWILAGILMALQVANTPLDLHGLAWASARCLARIQGWYAQRHAVQREVLLALAIMASGSGVAAILLLRQDFWRNALLVAGVSLTTGMTLVKGINYHYLEPLYGNALGPLRTADVVELVGIAAVLVAALAKLRKAGLTGDVRRDY